MPLVLLVMILMTETLVKVGQVDLEEKVVLLVIKVPLEILVNLEIQETLAKVVAAADACRWSSGWNR